jgi:hypothetical protein
VKRKTPPPPWSPSRAREAARADLYNLRETGRPLVSALRGALREDRVFDDPETLRAWVANHGVSFNVCELLREVGA